MARNRKRARERRPADASSLATARDSDASADPLDPLNHASGVEELAEAQLALGRPELADVPDEDELTVFEESEAAGGGGGSVARRPSAGSGAGGGGSGGGIIGPGGPGGRAPAPRENPGARLAGFLQGSWRELQRVQWPDRRQVFQATGVVIGFVIVAGVFLGLSDVVASKLVNLILK
jgi:preprotein translocase subunit SecE